MAGDANLTEVLAALRNRFPDVPEQLWRQIEGYLRLEYGAGRVYVEARKKRRHLQTIEAAGPDADINRLAEMLGVSPRQARNLRRLR